MIYTYYRLRRLRSTPGKLARGLAVGIFAGCFPFFGFQTLIAVALAIPLRGNPMLAAAGTWISNPLTYIPIYMFNFQVGRWILHTDDAPLTLGDLKDWATWQERGLEFIATLLLGCLVVGLVLGFIGYWLGWYALLYSRRQWLSRHDRPTSSLAAHTSPGPDPGPPLPQIPSINAPPANAPPANAPSPKPPSPVP
ncbi:DUF2062 domain-containing protein [Prochlorothrix hollandica]